jgi:hypothetical protein
MIVPHLLQWSKGVLERIPANGVGHPPLGRLAATLFPGVHPATTF